RISVLPLGAALFTGRERIGGTRCVCAGRAITAVLGDLFGKASAVSIAIAAIVINLVVVPITMLGLPLAKTPVASTAHPTERYSGFSEKLRETFKEPIVWAPLLAFALVLCDVKIPPILGHGLSLLSHASGGVAIFTSGIMLAAYKIKIDWIVALLVLLKNVVQPALVLGGLLWLGYGGPVVARAVLTTAIRRCQSRSCVWSATMC